MNWDKIKEKYPKASKIFQEWSADDNEFIICADPRCLYDFFDEQEVWVEIKTPQSLDGDFDTFIADIHLPKDSFAVDGIYKTRTEAEEKAFEKAFEILENKLEGEK